MVNVHCSPTSEGYSQNSKNHLWKKRPNNGPGPLHWKNSPLSLVPERFWAPCRPSHSPRPAKLKIFDTPNFYSGWIVSKRSQDNVTVHSWYFSLLSHWQISWIQNFTPQKHWKTPKNTRIWKNLHLAICFAQTLSVACVTNMRYASHLLAAAHLAPNWGHNSSSAQPLPHLDRLYYTA